MTFLRALVSLMRVCGFRRLFAARVASQGSDGIFEVALASYVLFNPQQAADPEAIAAAFAVVLLPYSALGPFVGVLLDRWPRRRILVVSQLLRAASMALVALLVTGASLGPPFFLLVLLVFSLNRFVLAGFSAAMPHVVGRDDLVEANSVAPTLGSLAYVIGGAAGAAVRAVGSDAVVVVVAVAGTLVAAWVASRLPFIGPTDDVPGPRLGQVAEVVARGFVEMLRTLPARGWLVLALVFLTRLPFGVVLLQALLLSRGPFAAAGDTGILRFGLAAAASAVGFAIAAFVTPWLAGRWSPIPYAAAALALTGAAALGLGWWLTLWSTAALAALVSLGAQSVKICCDTLMQRHVPDSLLGRAFSAYDLVYNGGLVAAVAIGAAALPRSGLLAWPVLVVGLLYVGLATPLVPAWQAATRADVRRGSTEPPA
ncbi:MAG: MFS transporter [Intrasporangium sp.]|uniref:MFS transporter n=1 Tax=Intrasporangium sp. TaxID=1925024 RepID=UPI002647A890|nr:MFS transporter [Intrasporangium sp.]MDN5797434.1 MFS transporter [Intrasporangium sp.]